MLFNWNKNKRLEEKIQELPKESYKSAEHCLVEFYDEFPTFRFIKESKSANKFVRHLALTSMAFVMLEPRKIKDKHWAKLCGLWIDSTNTFYQYFWASSEMSVYTDGLKIIYNRFEDVRSSVDKEYKLNINIGAFVLLCLGNERGANAELRSFLLQKDDDGEYFKKDSEQNFFITGKFPRQNFYLGEYIRKNYKNFW